MIRARGVRWLALGVGALGLFCIGLSLLFAFRTDALDKAFDKVRVGMTESELHRISDFDRLFDQTTDMAGGGVCYKGRCDGGEYSSFGQIFLNRDRVVTRKSLIRDYVDNCPNRVLVKLHHWLDWREGRDYDIFAF
jgi:hypothetical protein